MSGFMKWDPGILVGVEEIDLEHRTFVTLINKLDDFKDNADMAPRVLQALDQVRGLPFSERGERPLNPPDTRSSTHTGPPISP